MTSSHFFWTLVRRYTAAHTSESLGLLLLLIAQAFYEVALRYSTKFIVDEAVGQHSPAALTLIVTLLGIGAVLYLGVTLAGDWVWARATTAIGNTLRLDLFVAAHNTQSFAARPGSGDMIARFTADIGTVETGLVTSFPFAIMALVEVLLSLGAAAYMSPTLALIGAAGLAISLAAPQPLYARTARSADALRNFEGQMTGVVQENLLGQEAVAAYGLKNEMAKRFTQLLQQRQRLWSRSRMLSYLLERIPATTFTLVQIVVLAVSGRLAVEGTITLGEMVSFQALFAGLSGALYNLTWVVPSLIDTFAALRRIEAIIGAEPERHSQQQLPNRASSAVAIGSPIPHGDLVFENVSFSYPEANRLALDNVSFTVPRGSYVAVAGGSGAGKSTLLRLLLGFEPLQTGRICIGDTDIRSIPTSELRAAIGFVPQNISLFDMTVADNIRMGKLDATHDEVISAARAADIHDTITGLADSYHTRCGEAGDRFSSGQRQRIALARALIRHPSFLLLDETTSALDQLSEATLLRTLLTVRSSSTILAITHRLAMARDADCIVTLEGGRVAEIGNHPDLLGRNGIYTRLWRSHERAPAEASP